MKEILRPGLRPSSAGSFTSSGEHLTPRSVPSMGKTEHCSDHQRWHRNSELNRSVASGEVKLSLVVNRWRHCSGLILFTSEKAVDDVERLLIYIFICAGL